MRVAFTLIGGDSWTGGQNYLRNLLAALVQHQAGRLTPILFVGDDCTEAGLSAFTAISGLVILRTPLLDASRSRASLFQAVLLGRDPALHDLFVRHHIDLVFENARYWGWRLGIPAIAWIPDFQHRLLPRMFSGPARLKRELGFRAQVAGQRFIMLSSEDARTSCELFYPSTRGRTRCVHFAVPQEATADLAECRNIADSYGLPEQYFFMPNQFWRHKNHALVVEAIAILKQHGQRLVVAASGRTLDPRDPGHFARLQSLVEHLGVTEEMRFLGLLPYPHMLALMRASTALINPSLFEGWSTTVEEARAQGVPMLLSDLAVHREQMGSDARYFDRHSPHALADALASFPVVEPTQRALLAEQAGRDAARRVRRFAEEFAALAETVAEGVAR